MVDLSKYKEVGKTPNTVIYIVESEPDIILIVPREGTMDNAQDAHENVVQFHNYARRLGKPCASVVIMSKMLSQEPEARRAYTEIDPSLFYAGALVVENALSRALGGFFVGLTRPRVPTRLFDSVDNAVEWVRTMRRYNTEEMPSSVTLKKVGSAPHHDLMIAGADDILIVVPEEGFKDTAEASRLTVAGLREYAQKLGKKCGLVIIANNLLAQEVESRRIYAEGITPDLFFSVVMVVSSPLARAIGSLATRLTAMLVPISMCESIEAGIAWTEANRKS